MRIIVILCGLGVLSGCNSVECGEGTIETDGVCVSRAAAPECGPGTHYDLPSGRCVNDAFGNGTGVCGDGTNLVVSDAGVPTCVSLGGGGGCDTPLPCPPPTEPQTVSLCGRIYDLEDSRPLDDGNPDNGEPWKTVEVRVLDPFEFIPNPNTAPKAKVTPDSCGRYAVINAPLPAAGAVAVAVEDIVNSSGQPVFGDNHVLTGIADRLTAGSVRPTQRAWILRRSTDQMWSTSAGLQSGQTFGRLGVYIPMFINTAGQPATPFPGTPADNVMVAAVEGTDRVVHPEKDYYFDDATALERKMVSPTRSQTGRNGTGLYIMQPSIGTMSGVGNTPAGSCWRYDPAAAPVGAAFVQERVAEPIWCAL